MKRQGWRALCISALVMVFTHQPVLAQQKEDIGQLRQQMAEQRRLMEAMEKRLLELEGKERDRSTTGLEAGYTKSEGAMRRGITAKDIYDGGFYVKTEDDSFSLRMNGFAQVRYTFFEPEKGKSNHNFDVALARIAFSGNVFDPKVSYFMQYEASTFGNNN